MAVVNHAKKEINAKIVYFGPSGSGKHTALEYIFSRIKPALRGELKKVPAGSDALFCFDFSPFDTPLADGYSVRLHVYTLSGTVTNPATWKMTLKGCDGVVILIDGADERLAEGQASVGQLREFLSAYGVGLRDVPAVLQVNSYGQRSMDVDGDQLAAAVDLNGLPICRSRTSVGEGVLEALSTLSRMVLERIRVQRLAGEVARPEAAAEATVAPSMLSAVPLGGQPLDLPADPAGLLQLSVGSPVYEDCKTSISIPLDISCGSSCRRLIVTVAISPG